MVHDHADKGEGGWDLLLQQGRDAFNEARFFEAHEIWEEAWKRLAGDERRWVQGLIQVAAALYQIQRARPGPAAKLLGKALPKLQGAPMRWQQLEMGALHRDAAPILEALDRGETPDPTALKFRSTLLPQ